MKKMCILNVGGWDESILKEGYDRLSVFMDNAGSSVQRSEVDGTPVFLFEDNGVFDWETLARQVDSLLSELEQVRRGSF